MTGATVIPDSRVATPEQILASDELLRLIASSLRDLGSGPREAFILHAIEGFSVEEIVAITGQSADVVLAFVSARRATTCANLPAWPGSFQAASLRPARHNPSFNFFGRSSMSITREQISELADFQDENLAPSAFISSLPRRATKPTKKT